MSSDAEQMLKSGMLAVCVALAECGRLPHSPRDAILVRYDWQRLKSTARRGEIGASIHQFVRQLRANPLFAMILLGDDLMVAVPKDLCSLARAACRQLGLSSAGVALSQHF